MATALRDPDRLQTLRDTALLDAPAEPAFDALTRLASRLVGAPVALLSLVDADRQFFLSETGLAEPYRSGRETPLSHSFCQYVVAEDKPFVVSDALADARVAGNGAIEDLGVRAYLGVPVRAPDGAVLGALCAIEPQARAWTDADAAALADLAELASAAVGARLSERRAEREADDAQARLSEREALLALAVDAARLGLWSTDLRSGETFWDARSRELFGVAPDAPASAEVGQARVHPDDRADADAAFMRALDDPAGRYRSEKRVEGLDGRYRWILNLGQITRGPDGEPERILGLASDVTERRETERSLRRRSRELEAEVAARTTALQHRSEQARRLAAALARVEQRERRHLADVLHEDLQQILFGAALYIEAERENAPEAFERVGELVGQALELTRSLAHGLAAPGSSDGRLDRALSWLADAAGTAYSLDVRTEIDGELQVSADICDAVVHLVRELLFNVVKHSGVSTATLRARPAGERVVIEVADQGVGFDAGAEDERSSTGMGLRGVCDRARLLGGSCTVRTVEGGGTVVTMRVPRTRTV